MEAASPVPVSYYRCVAVLACLHLFGGVAALALGIANAIICGLFGSIGYGIWAAIIYFLAGATGFVSSMKGTRVSVVSHLIFSLLAACAATVQLGFGVGAAAADYAALRASWNGVDIGGFLAYRRRDTNGGLGLIGQQFSPYYGYSGSLDYFFRFGCSQTQRDTYWTYQASGPTVTDSLLAAFAIIEALTALMSAIYTCRICLCPPGITWKARPYASDVYDGEKVAVISAVSVQQEHVETIHVQLESKVRAEGPMHPELIAVPEKYGDPVGGGYNLRTRKVPEVGHDDAVDGFEVPLEEQFQVDVDGVQKAEAEAEESPFEWVPLDDLDVDPVQGQVPVTKQPQVHQLVHQYPTYQVPDKERSPVQFQMAVEKQFSYEEPDEGQREVLVVEQVEEPSPEPVDHVELVLQRGDSLDLRTRDADDETEQ